jgi:hypothetical protein
MVIEPVVRAIAKVPHIGPLLKTWQGWLIAIVVISQLVLPLHYYLVRRDPHDERFAWRMFSPMRMTECSLDMKVDKKRIDLSGEFHEAWIETAKRGRFVVIEAMAERMCKRNPTKPVTAQLVCRYIDRKEPVVYGGFDLCDAPEL